MIIHVFEDEFNEKHEMPGLKTDRFRYYRFTLAEHVISYFFTILF